MSNKETINNRRQGCMGESETLSWNAEDIGQFLLSFSKERARVVQRQRKPQEQKPQSLSYDTCILTSSLVDVFCFRTMETDDRPQSIGSILMILRIIKNITVTIGTRTKQGFLKSLLAKAQDQVESCFFWVQIKALGESLTALFFAFELRWTGAMPSP